MRARILIVEDHKRTSQSLAKGMDEAGFEAEQAPDGRAGFSAAMRGAFDAIVLDLGLPKMDGWGLLEALRRSGDKTPLIILTARDSVEDRVRGLDEGADDYLVKPFAFSELLSRVRALLRRQTPLNSPILRYETLELLPADLSATRNARRLDLSPKEFALLTLFIRHQGEPLSRSYLAEKVWNLSFDTETNIIDVAISRLREKLNATPGPRLIHTLRGVGYVLDAGRG